MNLESIIYYEPEIMFGVFLLAVGYTSLKVWWSMTDEEEHSEVNRLSQKYDDL
jgi:hypothetical protein